MPSTPHFPIRAYRPDDEESWLQCRVLSFLGSQYFDDVKTRRPVLDEPALALVATSPTDPGFITGILDIEFERQQATIDCVAVHPSWQGRGIASALLTHALPLLEHRNIVSIEAWTREDPAANSWYRAHGFTEDFRYLHVYATDEDDLSGFTTPERLSRPLGAFMHADIEDEDDLRARYRRVHICRQYVRWLTP